VAVGSFTDHRPSCLCMLMQAASLRHMWSGSPRFESALVMLGRRCVECQSMWEAAHVAPSIGTDTSCCCFHSRPSIPAALASSFFYGNRSQHDRKVRFRSIIFRYVTHKDHRVSMYMFFNSSLKRQNMHLVCVMREHSNRCAQC
jgi:hypothetical protein